MFPFSSRTSGSCDLDHTRPFQHGLGKPTAQTRASNLGPLSRKVHRAKTLGAWTVSQPTPGTFVWVSPLEFTYTVNRKGTTHGTKGASSKPRKPIPRLRP